MKKIIRVDSNGLFVEDVIIDDNANIPDDCVDDSQYPIPEGIHLPKWDTINKTWAEGKVFTLEELQNAKIQEVTNAYNTELNNTFTSSATGTDLVYDYSTPHSQELWKELLDSINAGYIPDTSFPINITLFDGTIVPHTKQELQQIGGEIAIRKMTLYGKLQNMITKNGSIMSAESIDALNQIHW